VHLVDICEAATERVAQISQRIRAKGAKSTSSNRRFDAAGAGYVDAAANMRPRSTPPICRLRYCYHRKLHDHAGLVVGFDHLRRKERIIGMSISLPGAEAAATVRGKARETAELLGWPTASLDDRVTVQDDYLGAGYGQPTDAMLEAVALVARQEGILLDPVYTGKAMSGLISLARSGFFKPHERVVFWHTGGLPALFAYQDAFEPVVAGSRREAV
jgi:1-aminocyclopropane-1-carboxylate deaminase/D-cysteine desulfhydrase-like pyridoxal-dependent ACC family enzyme